MCFQRLASQHASERFVDMKCCGCWGYLTFFHIQVSQSESHLQQYVIEATTDQTFGYERLTMSYCPTCHPKLASDVPKRPMLSGSIRISLLRGDSGWHWWSQRWNRSVPELKTSQGPQGQGEGWEGRGYGGEGWECRCPRCQKGQWRRWTCGFMKTAEL